MMAIPMDPRIGKVAFNIALLMLILALIPLPFLSVDSAEFVVAVIALTISSIFLALVLLEVRRQAKIEA